jgi:hypothetical protein
MKVLKFFNKQRRPEKASWIGSIAFPFESGKKRNLQVGQLGETKTSLNVVKKKVSKKI